MKTMNQYQQKPFSKKIQMDVNIMKKLVQDFERAKNSTLMIRSIILQNYSRLKIEDSYNNSTNNDHFKALDHHSMMALDTFVNSISMLKSCDFNIGFIEKQKLSESDPCNSEVSADQESPKCYKKRKIGSESKEKEVTHLTDDGYAWRKYGQKQINDYHHPREYFRCTHKQEQKCQATKQIQQVSENPTKYKLIYHNNHTCNNNILNPSPYMINSSDEHSSAFVLSFDGSNPMNPMLFPESISDAAKDMNHMMIGKASGASSSSSSICEQSEHKLIEVAENNASISTTLYLDEDYYSSIMADFSELFPDFSTIFL